MRICFHGTNKKAADKIVAEGFNVGTYFAFHLEDALAFGGDHVFFVRFEEGGFKGEDSWQFHLRDHIPPDKIWKLVRYLSTEILCNTTGENNEG